MLVVRTRPLYRDATATSSILNSSDSKASAGTSIRVASAFPSGSPRRTAELCRVESLPKRETLVNRDEERAFPVPSRPLGSGLWLSVSRPLTPGS